MGTTKAEYLPKEKKNAWLNYNEAEVKDIMAYNEGYRKFLSVCKTERECVKESIRLAEAAGYTDLKECIKNNTKLKTGDRVYYNNMDKALVLFQVGEEPVENGMNILGAHIDSPRLDIKQNPLYEDTEMALLDTHYYGGIKKYQWVALPMALHGVMVLCDGTKKDIIIGEDECDPVVGITDLLIHLAANQMEKKGAKVVEGEDLNVLIGSMPLEGAEKDAVKHNVLKLLWDKYGIKEDDFLSAEIEVVPAGPARDFGLDRSMIMGYGHDDRVCAYPSLTAMLELPKNVKKSCVCILADKEEIGSAGATGMQSRFFENAVAEFMNCCEDYSDLKLKRAFTNSKMLSSDVSAAFDPNYPSVFEKKNSAYFGRGLTFNKYTGARGKSGSNDANAEYMAEIRKVMEEGNVAFQTAELGKVDEGGGGTIACYMAVYNMQVIDSGVPVLNMHAPWEIVSKIDVYEAQKGYGVFLTNI